jgi:hypothetical protein
MVELALRDWARTTENQHPDLIQFQQVKFAFPLFEGKDMREVAVSGILTGINEEDSRFEAKCTMRPFGDRWSAMRTYINVADAESDVQEAGVIQIVCGFAEKQVGGRIITYVSD